MENAFTQIYQSSSWSQDHKNGPGSTLKSTSNVRQILSSIIEKYKIKSIVDAPCGLYSWIDHIIDSRISYVGMDIVKAQIEENLKHSASKKKKLTFVHADLTQSYPDVAKNRHLIFCRHLTQHLTQESTLKVLNHFKQSGC